MSEWRAVELSAVEIAGPRLTLRAFGPADEGAVLEAMQDRRMHEFLVLPDPYTPGDAHDYVLGIAQAGRTEGTALESAVVETATGRLVGACSLRLPGPRSIGAEIGYAIYPAGQGHGYAAEAVRMLARWGFDHDLPRIEIRAAVANLASIRSALNAGFHFEGIERCGVPTPRGPSDGAVLSRTPADSGDPVVPAFAPLPADGLTDGVLTLRVARSSDGHLLWEEDQDAEALRWTFTGQPRNMAVAAARAEQAPLQWLVGQAGTLVIQDVATASAVGTIQLRLAGPPAVASIGYSVLPAWRGNGITGRALRLLARWAFGPGGFHRLELGANIANIASQHAARSGGFHAEDVRTGRLRTPDGIFGDEIGFALVRPSVNRAG